MSTEHSRRDTPFLVLSAAALLACRILALRPLPVYDDAFITFRYARNLAQGLGFVYQAGERVLGTTTPLFGVLCAIPFALHLPMPETVRGFNALCDVATLVLTWNLLRTAAPTAARYVFAALFAVAPLLNRIAIGGMEMNLYLLVAVTAITLDQRGRRAAVALAALGYFLRPESLLLVLLLVARTWRREGVRAALVAAAVAGAILAGPLLVIHAWYGAALSQSVAAKFKLAHPPLLEVLRPLLAYEPFQAALLPFAAWGAWRAGRTRGPVRVVALWLLLEVAAYGAARPKIWSWYVEPLAWAMVVLAACGVADLLQRALGARLERLAPRLSAAASALAVLVWAGVAWRQGPSPVTERVFRPLAAWCRVHATPATTFMAYDVGALGYDSGGRIYDQAGLVWPPGLTLPPTEVVRRYSPDYLYFNATRDAARFVARPEIAARYQPVARFSQTGETSLALDPATAATGWLQDYVVYERRDRIDAGRP